MGKKLGIYCLMVLTRGKNWTYQVMFFHLKCIIIFYNNRFLDLHIEDDIIKKLCLIEIEKMMVSNGRSLKEFESMPLIMINISMVMCFCSMTSIMMWRKCGYYLINMLSYLMRIKNVYDHVIPTKLDYFLFMVIEVPVNFLMEDTVL